MPEAERNRGRTPLWGVVLTIIAALMLAGLVVMVLLRRPGPQRLPRWQDDECDVLAKVVNCMPASPRIEYAAADRAVDRAADRAGDRVADRVAEGRGPAGGHRGP